MSVLTRQPDRGDLVWLSFSPQAGSEQAGRRPGIVLSTALYHRRSRLVIVCPITNQRKGYPFEVLLPAGLPVQGVVLVDHIRSIDKIARQLEVVGHVPDNVMDEITAKLAALIDFAGN